MRYGSRRKDVICLRAGAVPTCMPSHLTGRVLDRPARTTVHGMIMSLRIIRAPRVLILGSLVVVFGMRYT